MLDKSRLTMETVTEGAKLVAGLKEQAARAGEAGNGCREYGTLCKSH